MPTYSERTVEIRRVEWGVPADAPWGACWNQVSLAIHAAHEHLRDLGILVSNSDAADDQIRVRGTDEEIVVFIELKKGRDGQWRTV